MDDVELRTLEMERDTALSRLRITVEQAEMMHDQIISLKADIASERKRCAQMQDELLELNRQFIIQREAWNDTALKIESDIVSEREQCARECDAIAIKYSAMDPEREASAIECAEAIRSRGRG